MRLKDNGDSVCIWISANDTYEWACKLGASWPCSHYSGKRIFAAFDTSGLYDLTVDGRDGSYIQGDCNEFNAITSDFIATRIQKDHPCYFVTVGQFQG